MSWSQKRALVNESMKIAKKTHGDKFTIKQLKAASKNVNGGFSTNPFKPIKTLSDISHMQNHMANIDGGYPLGMSGCEVVGINGGCGASCPVFKNGNCHVPEEQDPEDIISELGLNEATQVMDLYSCFEDYQSPEAE